MVCWYLLLQVQNSLFWVFRHYGTFFGKKSFIFSRIGFLIFRLFCGCRYRTGLFSSPHLMEVVERIRVDGDPVAREVFAEEVVAVHACLWVERSDDSDMPAFFHMLFVVAIRLFLRLKVHVAVIEVGLGGCHLISCVFLVGVFEENPDSYCG